jgi:environmental stress-induced protein Ves
VTEVHITALDPAGYRRSPWKNGGGVTVDIADACRDGAAPGAWEGMIWRFGRTAITTAGPFSDLSGYDRVQVVIAGQGLVLVAPDHEIDVRTPFVPVRFAGETRIVSRLEAGPVEVVNLIGDRLAVRLDMRVLEAGQALHLAAGTHIAYCPAGAAVLGCRQEQYELAQDHALRLVFAVESPISCAKGRLLIASAT